MIELNNNEALLVSAAGFSPFQNGVKLGDFEWQPNLLDFILLQTSLTSSGMLIGITLYHGHPLQNLLSGALIGGLILPVSATFCNILDDIVSD